MKFVYLDESGISVNEPILVVAGVIINADHQWMLVQQYVDELACEYVPQISSRSVVFHAKDMFHGTGGTPFDRRKYPIERSHEALRRILEIPSKFMLPVVFGFYKKREGIAARMKAKGITPKIRRYATGLLHSLAYSLCAIAAESFMKKETPYGEIGQLVAELNTDTRQAIKIMHDVLQRKNPRKETEELFAHMSDFHPGLLPITKLVDTVHFSEKQDAFMLQIADACALAIRYALQGKEGTQEFTAALLRNSYDQIKLDQNPSRSGLGVIKFAKTEVAG